MAIFGLNDCKIVGQVNEPIQIKTYGQGSQIGTLALSVVEYDSYKKENTTTLVHVTAFGKTVENIQKYCSVGDTIYCQCKFSTKVNTYNGKEYTNNALVVATFNNLSMCTQNKEKAIDQANEDYFNETTLDVEESDLPF